MRIRTTDATGREINPGPFTSLSPADARLTFAEIANTALIAVFGVALAAVVCAAFS